jgi:hypothetical protein
MMVSKPYRRPSMKPTQSLRIPIYDGVRSNAFSSLNTLVTSARRSLTYSPTSWRLCCRLPVCVARRSPVPASPRPRVLDAEPAPMRTRPTASEPTFGQQPVECLGCVHDVCSRDRTTSLHVRRLGKRPAGSGHGDILPEGPFIPPSRYPQFGGSLSVATWSASRLALRPKAIALRAGLRTSLP